MKLQKTLIELCSVRRYCYNSFFFVYQVQFSGAPDIIHPSLEQHRFVFFFDVTSRVNFVVFSVCNIFCQHSIFFQFAYCPIENVISLVYVFSNLQTVLCWFLTHKCLALLLPSDLLQLF